MTEAEQQIHERRNGDRGLFRWDRLWHAIRRDPTRLLEVTVALLGLILNGVLIVFAITTFPPPEVEFLLRSWWILAGRRLGVVLLVLGALQIAGTLTHAHRFRATVAALAAAVNLVTVLAYLFADLPAYFQAWVMYAAIAACQFYLFVRNLADYERRCEAERTLAQAVRQKRCE